MSDEKAVGISIATAENMIKAMERLKETSQKAMEDFQKTIEMMLDGHGERISNLETAFEEAFKNAQANFAAVVNQMAEEGDPAANNGNDPGEHNVVVTDVPSEYPAPKS